ncbi:MAG TPA: cobalamin-dependent protein [Candidatus Lokiarchaeia archaeon]|nr:cobalamin-dependent protein [Candidatus Lokiarchaeia archaeon]
MTNKKVLFIYPPVNLETTRGLESNLLKTETNNIEISFLYLESFLRKRLPGIECEYLDFRIDDVQDAERLLLQLFSTTTITHVAMTCYSCHYLSVLNLANTIKQINKNIIIIVGGFHPTIHPEDFTFEGSPIDYIIRGEGEFPLAEIVEDDIFLPPKPRIIKNQDFPDLDELSPINLDLMSKYKKSLNFSELSMYFSRGCLFDCSFCISRDDTCGLKKYRSMSLNGMRLQLEAFEKYEPSRIIIQDPLFGVNKRWFDDVTSMLGKKDRTYKVKVEMHVDLINKHRLEKLVGSALDLTIGFESASPQMLHVMNKTRNPSRYVDNTKTIIKNYSKSGQELVLNVLIGHPGENRLSIDETFNFLEGVSNYFNEVLPKFSLFRLYPGTPVYRYMQFFEMIFKTVFYMKNWWYHDVDFSLVPSIIDPSRNLDIISEISYSNEKINMLLRQISKSKNLALKYQLVYMKYLSRMNRTFKELEGKMIRLKCDLSRKEMVMEKNQ